MKYVAIGVKDAWWTVISKPATKEEAEKIANADGSVPKGEIAKVVTLAEALAHLKIVGREYLSLGNILKSMGQKAIEKGKKEAKVLGKKAVAKGKELGKKAIKEGKKEAKILGKKAVAKGKEYTEKGKEFAKEKIKDAQKAVVAKILEDTRNRKNVSSSESLHLKAAKEIVNKKFEKGGSMKNTYRLSAWKDQGIEGLIEGYYEKNVTIDSTLEGAIERAKELMAADSKIVRYDISKVNAKSSKKIAYVTSKGVTKYCGGGNMAKGGNVQNEDINTCKELVSVFVKKYGDIFGLSESKMLEMVKFRDYLGYGADVSFACAVESGINKLEIGQTKPTQLFLNLESSINPNGISGKGDIARAYTIHLEIKGRKRYTQRTYEEGVFFKIHDYGRSVVDVIDTVMGEFLTLRSLIKKHEIKFTYGSIMKNGGKMLFGGNVADKYKVAQIQGGDWIIYDVKSETIISQKPSRSEIENLKESIVKTRSLHDKIQSNIKAGLPPMKFEKGGSLNSSWSYEIGGL